MKKQNDFLNTNQTHRKLISLKERGTIILYAASMVVQLSRGGLGFYIVTVREMAAIDKTYYKTKEEYTEALMRAQQHGLEDLVYDYKEGGGTLWNTSEEVDAYIFRHCDIKFIQDRLKEQYGNSLKYKGRILVEWIDGGDSEAELVRTVIDKNIYSVTFPDILREITWMYYRGLYADKFGEIRDTIKILSITNLSF